MKKLISLSTAVLITVVVFAQDTIPPPRNNNFPDSAKMDTRDSMTTGNKWNKDTASIRNKWTDSSMHKMRDSASTGSTTKWADSTMSSTTNSAKDNMPATADKSTQATQTDSSSTTGSATNSNSNTSTDKSTTTTTTTKPIDRVVMTDNQVMVVKNGDSTLLADSIKLQSGAVVQKDGSVRFKNGSTTKLKNGQYIDLIVSEGKKTKKTTSTKTKSSS